MSPTRRALLRSGGAVALAATAGCGAQTTPDTSTETTVETTRTTTSRATTSRAATDESTSATASPDLAVDASLVRRDHLLRGRRLGDWRPLPADDGTSFGDLPAAARGAVRTAVEDGRFTTDDPTDDFLAGIDDVDLVEDDGEYYTLTHTFTEYVLNLDDGVDVESAPESETAVLYDDAVERHPSVQEALRTVLPYGTEVASEEYRTLVLTDELRSFLDEYEYARSDAGFGRLEFHVERHEPPYRLSARPATDEELYGHEVVDASEFTDAGQQVVRRTLDSRRRSPTNLDGAVGTLRPDSVPRRLEREFVRGGHVSIDGSVAVFTVRHVHWDDQPFELAVGLTDDAIDPGDPAEVDLSVTNIGDLAAELTVPGLAPFGILWAERTDGEDKAVQLWSPRYEDSDHVTIEDGVAKPDSYRPDLTVGPGETVTRTYRFGRESDPVDPGTYSVWGDLWAKWPTEPGLEKYDWNSEIYPYELRIDVTEP